MPYVMAWLRRCTNILNRRITSGIQIASKKKATGQFERPTSPCEGDVADEATTGFEPARDYAHRFRVGSNTRLWDAAKGRRATTTGFEPVRVNTQCVSSAPP
mmetsp:Transcript_21063/g.34091  ORF Transcript_21063/g.34091 Transcript_21063/m.34091 type:complete len:102 (-) Transcript_21063:209-514(-)